MKEIILTGDRPTGRLHVGHYVGSPERAGKASEFPAATTKFIL